jgi:hypothetical protein
VSRLAALAALTAVVLAVPAPALADPAGPTDYRTDILSVEPTIDGLEIRMLGGDSFMELTAPAGRTILVTGYRGEPYLRFEPDGTVLENRRSPTTYLNLDRYGEVEIPPEATPAARPDWVEVADDGRYAWHDHRTHWMNSDPPPGAEPGDTILEAVVPLVVDATPVTVTVQSTWVDPPSPWASSLGFFVGLVGALTAVRLLRPEPMLRGSLLVASTAALVMGVWERASMPPEAAASLLVVLLPVGGLLFGWFARAGSPIAGMAASFAAAHLLVWAGLRWRVMVEPILPTDAPWALDRFLTAFVAAVGVVVLVQSLRLVFAPAPGAAEGATTA